jgi:hypothetical protein
MTECGFIFNRHKWKALGYGFQACSKCGIIEQWVPNGIALETREATLSDWRQAQARYQEMEESRKITIQYLKQS